MEFNGYGHPLHMRETGLNREPQRPLLASLPPALLGCLWVPLCLPH